MVGVFQCLALIPGFSRSGMTISGGLYAKLSREDAVRGSFLLSLPIILGSGLKKTIELVHVGALASVGTPLLISSLVAFCVGLYAIHFTMRYVSQHSMDSFILYRVSLGVFLVIAFLFS